MDYISLIENTAETLFHQRLKREQVTCLELLLQRKDFLAILPTGFGKSRIFQLAPHVLQKEGNLSETKCVALIISPLNSIMIDQIKNLHTMGIAACAIDYDCLMAHTFESLEDSEDGEDTDFPTNDVLSTAPLSEILLGKFSLIYAHPEALLSSQQGERLLRELEKKDIIRCIGIDEAHIILEWGTEFRKDFSRIGDNLLSRFPEVPVMVFTATASPSAQKQIISNLNLRNPEIISINPDRPNIRYSKIMRPPSSKTEEHLEEILKPIAEGIASEKQNYPLTFMYTDTSVISFCYSYLEKNLGQKQYLGDAIPENRLFAQYHKSYTGKMKTFIVQELCKPNSKIRFVLCTVALGMGLNAPHVRNIIHYKPPTSIEKYFQETGRAGRDGAPSLALLYYNNTDIRSNRPGIDKAIIKYCKNNSACLREVMLECFGCQPVEGNQNCCDMCDKKINFE